MSSKVKLKIPKKNNRRAQLTLRRKIAIIFIVVVAIAALFIAYQIISSVRNKNIAQQYYDQLVALPHANSQPLAHRCFSRENIFTTYYCNDEFTIHYHDDQITQVKLELKKMGMEQLWESPEWTGLKSYGFGKSQHETDNPPIIINEDAPEGWNLTHTTNRTSSDIFPRPWF